MICITLMPIVESALTQLHIKNRKITLATGTLCFCTLPSGLTFNLFAEGDGIIRLSRLIRDASIGSAEGCLECRKATHPQSAVGFQVAAEGDLRFYAEQTIDADDAQRERKIMRMISAYCRIITAIQGAEGPIGSID